MKMFEIGGTGYFNPEIPLTIFGDFEKTITNTPEADAKENLQTTSKEMIAV